jgi:hypothetical protein
MNLLYSGVYVIQIEITHDEFLIFYYRKYTEQGLNGKLTHTIAYDISWVGNIDAFENEMVFVKLANSD